MKNSPALRIAVTNKCNLNCQYCPKDGDSYLVNNRPLTLQDFVNIVKIANQLGVTCFSITGGEPLVVPNITFPLAKQIKKLKKLDYLKLNTNGVFLKKFHALLVETNFTQIKVSLDIITPNSIKTTSHYQSNVNPVLSGITKLTNKGVPIRLQVVVTKQNINQIDKIIAFCDKEQIDLKLFDLTYYKDSLSSDKNYWKKNYVSFNEISKQLEKKFGNPQIVHAVGGYGHPNKIFTTNHNVRIMLRDTEISAHYAPECHQCSNFMCQDGLCNLTLSSDGHIKLCRPKGIDLGLNLLNPDQSLKSSREIRSIIGKALKSFDNSKEIKRSFSEINLPAQD